MAAIPALAVLGASVLAGLTEDTGAQADPSEPVCRADAAEARLSEVLDARSLRLADGRVLRLAGIEPFDLLLPEAEDTELLLQNRLAVLLDEHPLGVRLVSEPDRYGRLPALVWAGERLVQETLAREALAIAFAGGEPLPCFGLMLAAESEARRARRGFWADHDVPWAAPNSLRRSIGRFTIFEGVVRTVGNRRATTYLNFGDHWLSDVTAEIPDKARVRFFGEEGLAMLAGRRVRLRGYLEEKGGPMLLLTSPQQLEILGPATPQDPPAP